MKEILLITLLSVHILCALWALFLQKKFTNEIEFIDVLVCFILGGKSLADLVKILQRNYEGNSLWNLTFTPYKEILLNDIQRRKQF